MPLTGSQYRSLIVAELNGGPPLAQNIEALWDLNARYGAAPIARYLWTKLQAIDFLLGNLDETEQFPLEGDLVARMDNRRTILLALRSGVVAEILKLGPGGGLGQGPVVGLLNTQVIIPSDPGRLRDANDTYYTGDPNKRPWPVQPP